MPRIVASNVREGDAPATDRKEEERKVIADLQKDIGKRAVDARSRLNRQLAFTAALSVPEAVSRDYLRSIAVDLVAATLADVVQERHLTGVCAYPACDKPPSRRYNARRPAAADSLDQFCSKTCLDRYRHYLLHCLGQEKPVLLEDGQSATATNQPSSKALQALEGAVGSLRIAEHPTTSANAVPPDINQPSFEGSSARPKVAPRGALEEVAQELDEDDLPDADSDLWEEEDVDVRLAVREAMALRNSLRAQGEDV